MLSKIFGKKSDHPMVDIKSTQAILEDLPKNDVYKLLAELTEWIGSVAEHTEFKVDYQFAILRLLDDTAQSHARKLAREYFTPHELNTFQENRMWMTLDNLSRSTATAYFNAFKRYSNDDKGSSTIRVQVPLLLAHTVNAYIAQLKYISARYGVVDKAIWENLAQIYNCAEQQKFLDTPVNLSSGVAGNTTVKCQMARLFGWYGSGVNALSPLVMHLLERIVAQYCAAIDIHLQKTEGDHVCFDLKQPAAPARVSIATITHPTTRYVNMSSIQPKLEALIKILDKGVIPDDLNLGGQYEAKVVVGVAQYLWDFLKKPPMRQTPRRKVKVNLAVFGGFETSLERVNAGLDLSSAKPMQWELEDISAKGFLTILPPQGIENFRIGSLLCVQPAGVSHWGSAIVRHMSRDENNQLHIGVEMLASQIACVALSQSGSAGGGFFEDGQLALWLYAKQGSQTGEAQLLMRVDTFSASRSLQTEIDEKSYLLIPNGLVEKGPDYDLAKFRLVEQEGGHNDESY